MLPLRRPIAALLFLLAAAAAAQQPRATILLDPAHGGPDGGAHLANSVLEKDVTLAFAARLRAALGAANFSVLATRDTDPAALLPPDQRAGFANHARPAACIVLHASASGNGIHLVASNLPAAAPQRTIAWDTAQSASVPQSLALALQLDAAFVRAKLPVVLLRAHLRPLDNLTCPAVAVELAPLDNSPVTDPAYQQRAADAIARAIVAWRAQFSPQPATGAVP